MAPNRYKKTNRFAEAEVHYTDALNLVIKGLGPADPEVACLALKILIDIFRNVLTRLPFTTSMLRL